VTLNLWREIQHSFVCSTSLQQFFQYFKKISQSKCVAEKLQCKRSLRWRAPSPSQPRWFTLCCNNSFEEVRRVGKFLHFEKKKQIEDLCSDWSVTQYEVKSVACTITVLQLQITIVRWIITIVRYASVCSVLYDRNLRSLRLS